MAFETEESNGCNASLGGSAAILNQVEILSKNINKKITDEEKITVTVKFGGFESVEEADDLLKELSPFIAKLNGQATLTP